MHYIKIFALTLSCAIYRFSLNTILIIIVINNMCLYIIFNLIICVYNNILILIIIYNNFFYQNYCLKIVSLLL